MAKQTQEAPKLKFNTGWEYDPAPESTSNITIAKQYNLFINGQLVARQSG